MPRVYSRKKLEQEVAQVRKVAPPSSDMEDSVESQKVVWAEGGNERPCVHDLPVTLSPSSRAVSPAASTFVTVEGSSACLVDSSFSMFGTTPEASCSPLPSCVSFVFSSSSDVKTPTPHPAAHPAAPQGPRAAPSTPASKGFAKVVEVREPVHQPQVEEVKATPFASRVEEVKTTPFAPQVEEVKATPFAPQMGEVKATPFAPQVEEVKTTPFASRVEEVKATPFAPQVEEVKATPFAPPLKVKATPRTAAPPVIKDPQEPLQAVATPPVEAVKPRRKKRRVEQTPSPEELMPLPAVQGGDVYLVRLTMKGFKSFRDRTVVELSEGFNCVVGVNGSGKSNVLDALCFVLGMPLRYTRCKHLKDCINNQSKQATVSVVLKVASEIKTVSRDTARGYTLNGTKTTHDGVKTFFKMLGADVTFPQRFVILQQQTSSLLNSTPLEMLRYVEDLCGGGQLRDETAELKTKLSALNLKLGNLNAKHAEYLEAEETGKCLFKKWEAVQQGYTALKTAEIDWCVKAARSLQETLLETDAKIRCLNDKHAKAAKSHTDAKSHFEATVRATHDAADSVNKCERDIENLRDDVKQAQKNHAMELRKTRDSELSRKAIAIATEEITANSRTLKDLETEAAVLRQTIAADGGSRQWSASCGIVVRLMAELSLIAEKTKLLEGRIAGLKHEVDHDATLLKQTSKTLQNSTNDLLKTGHKIKQIRDTAKKLSSCPRETRFETTVRSLLGGDVFGCASHWVRVAIEEHEKPTNNVLKNCLQGTVYVGARDAALSVVEKFSEGKVGRVSCEILPPWYGDTATAPQQTTAQRYPVPLHSVLHERQQNSDAGKRILAFLKRIASSWVIVESFADGQLALKSGLQAVDRNGNLYKKNGEYATSENSSRRSWMLTHDTPQDYATGGPEQDDPQTILKTLEDEQFKLNTAVVSLRERKLRLETKLKQMQRGLSTLHYELGSLTLAKKQKETAVGHHDLQGMDHPLLQKMSYHQSRLDRIEEQLLTTRSILEVNTMRANTLKTAENDVTPGNGAERLDSLKTAKQNLKRANSELDDCKDRLAVKTEQKLQCDTARTALSRLQASIMKDIKEAETARCETSKKLSSILHNIPLKDRTAVERSVAATTPMRVLLDEQETLCVRKAALQEGLKLLDGERLSVHLEKMRDFVVLKSEEQSCANEIHDRNMELDAVMEKRAEIVKKTVETINSELYSVFSALTERGCGCVFTVPDSKGALFANGISLLVKPTPEGDWCAPSRLSGGQRALTAAAILTSFRAAFPSPFCLLDEVDASLDSLKTAKLAQLVANHPKQTVCISLRHQLYTAAQTIIGVYQEGGSSRVVMAAF